MKNNEHINDKLMDKLMDNKMLLRIKENKIKDYYEKINNISKIDKNEETNFSIRYKRIIGHKLSKKNINYKSKTKKK